MPIQSCSATASNQITQQPIFPQAENSNPTNSQSGLIAISALCAVASTGLFTVAGLAMAGARNAGPWDPAAGCWYTSGFYIGIPEGFTRACLYEDVQDKKIGLYFAAAASAISAAALIGVSATKLVASFSARNTQPMAPSQAHVTIDVRPETELAAGGRS